MATETAPEIPESRGRAKYPARMGSERETLASVVARLERALERGTGTTLDADEVRIVGRLIYAMGSAALGTATGRKACAVCGRPEHKTQAVDEFPRHEYLPAILIPVTPGDGR